MMPSIPRCLLISLLTLPVWVCASRCQNGQWPVRLSLAANASHHDFFLIKAGRPAAVVVSPMDSRTVCLVRQVFATDLERVSREHSEILSQLPTNGERDLILAGTIDHSPFIAELSKRGALDTSQLQDRWESAIIAIIEHPFPHVRRALVIAGSDDRGAAFAMFELSRQMGVSPWYWWADVPIQHHRNVYIASGKYVQLEPSVKYRGIFLNDEDWGLRPWAAKKMDPDIENIGPNTYARVFELLLRLHANSLWPAMHPGTLPFNTNPENARLADRWGIVVGSSHSEALLRNNVGEWDQKEDGPWNYQINQKAINAYWEKRLEENGRYQNFYTIGMRGVHDSGLEATGDLKDKVKLVEQIIASQRALLAKYVNRDFAQVPQVLWLYKESLDLYRAGMKIPDDVTLGWTDDNYGYIRQLPNAAEQRRSGGSAVYYHVSYWGDPQDYLWLCTTPPSLIREEMTKAYDHNARRYWILNVGDLKPAEIDIEYFLDIAWNEPAMASLDQRTFLERWAAEQFGNANAAAIASILGRYYRLSFVRKPEFMGFNEDNEGIHRTSFNPLAWPSGNYGQNGSRMEVWNQLARQAREHGSKLPAADHSAYFELVKYPIEASAAQNLKFLFTDRTFLDASQHHDSQREADAAQAQAAYERIQNLTLEYNHLENGKWDGMMSSAPRDRQVFKTPSVATSADADRPASTAWMSDHSVTPRFPRRAAGFLEQHGTVSINATHFTHQDGGTESHWRILHDLGISDGGCVVYGYPGRLANLSGVATAPDAHSPWLKYEFTTVSSGPANLALYLLPTFPVDSEHRLRFAVSIDEKPPEVLDVAGAGEWHENSAPTWRANVLRNASILNLPVASIGPGHHTIRLIYMDPGVIFEHLVLTFAGAPPGYPLPPET